MKKKCRNVTAEVQVKHKSRCQLGREVLSEELFTDAHAADDLRVDFEADDLLLSHSHTHTLQTFSSATPHTHTPTHTHPTHCLPRDDDVLSSVISEPTSQRKHNMASWFQENWTYIFAVEAAICLCA